MYMNLYQLITFVALMVGSAILFAIIVAVSCYFLCQCVNISNIDGKPSLRVIVTNHNKHDDDVYDKLKPSSEDQI